MTDEKKITLPHNIVMEDRKRLTATGVCDVSSFDEQTIVAETDMGGLSVKGNDLRITRLSLDIGELMIEGEIDALVYSESKTKSGGFFGRVFR